MHECLDRKQKNTNITPNLFRDLTAPYVQENHTLHTEQTHQITSYNNNQQQQQIL